MVLHLKISRVLFKYIGEHRAMNNTPKINNVSSRYM